jgi:tetratricopeptide (TPR) repeat protein
MANVRTHLRHDLIEPGEQHVAGASPPALKPLRTPAWPVRTGLAPPLTDSFVPRSETAPGLAAASLPGTVTALVSGRPAAEGSPARGEPCGITQLAVYCAESLWWSREVDLLAWVTATSRASVLAGYLEAAAVVGIDPVGTAEQTAAQFTGWLRQTARPWLMVLDDLRDPANLEGLWPYGPAGRVVITGPEEKVVAGRPGVQVVPVGAFSPREAMKYLMSRLSADPDQRHGAMALVTELGCQPLALAQASATISTSIVSCKDYQDRFTRRRARLAGPGGERPPVGEVTWRLSADQADRLVPGGAVTLVLTLAALLAGGAIPGTVFTAPATCGYLAAGGAPAVGDAEHAWDAVLALERTGLLAVNAGSDPAAVWLSPAVAAQVQAATPPELSGQAVDAAADALAEAWPEDPQPWLAAALRSCVASLRQAGGDRLWAAGEPHPLLLRTGRSLDDARLTGPAASYWAELTATCDRLCGPDGPATVATGSHLARALLAAGHPSEAVTWAKWAVVGQTRDHGPSHPATLTAHLTLGQALTAAGRHGQAIAVLEQAVAEHERVHGAGHLETLGARDGLATACQAAGRAAEAVGHYQRTLTDREHAYGPDHPGTVATRENLAAACLADGQHAQAIAHYHQALTGREAAYGPDHPDTLAARATLAAACRSAGKIADGLALSEQVCTDYRRVLGPDHPGTLASQAGLARAYRDAGRLADAAALLRDTLTRCEQALPPEHPLTQALRDG